MNPEVIRLWRTRPFQIAAIWEAFCIVIGVVAYTRTGEDLAMVAGIFAGVIPMAFVMLRFIKRQKDDGADRSKDIVQ